MFGFRTLFALVLSAVLLWSQTTAIAASPASPSTPVQVNKSYIYITLLMDESTTFGEAVGRFGFKQKYAKVFNDFLYRKSMTHQKVPKFLYSKKKMQWVFGSGQDKVTLDFPRSANGKFRINNSEFNMVPLNQLDQLYEQILRNLKPQKTSYQDLFLPRAYALIPAILALVGAVGLLGTGGYSMIDGCGLTEAVDEAIGKDPTAYANCPLDEVGEQKLASAAFVERGGGSSDGPPATSTN